MVMACVSAMPAYQTIVGDMAVRVMSKRGEGGWIRGLGTEWPAESWWLEGEDEITKLDQMTDSTIEIHRRTEKKLRWAWGGEERREGRGEGLVKIQEA